MIKGQTTQYLDMFHARTRPRPGLRDTAQALRHDVNTGNGPSFRRLYIVTGATRPSK
jgi:hypothetical protein